MLISRDQILQYLEGNFGLDVKTIDDTTELFSTGLLDSFSVADLLMFLEDNGNFTVEPYEVVVENIDTVSSILDFSRRKTEALAS